MRLVRVTAPTVEPLTAADVRLRLGLDASVADGVLQPLITAARQEIDGADGWLGRALNTQTWDMFLDYFPQSHFHRHMFSDGVTNAGIEIPLPPLQSVSSVKYIDAVGVTQTWDSANYLVIEDRKWQLIPVYGLTWPTTRHQPNAIAVRFVAGYGDAGSDVPEPIRQALAEKVSLARAMARPDPTLRSEATDGIDSYSYSTSQDFADVLRSSIDGRLTQYRIW